MPVQQRLHTFDHDRDPIAIPNNDQQSLESLSCSAPSPTTPPLILQTGAGDFFVFESPVQSTKAWRAQMKAEKDSGYKGAPTVLISSAKCTICTVHIGAGHMEEELYFLPVYEQYIEVVDDTRYYKAAVLYACGGCARRHQLGIEHLVISAETWRSQYYVPKDCIARLARELLSAITEAGHPIAIRALFPDMMGQLLTHTHTHEEPLRSIPEAFEVTREEQERPHQSRAASPPTTSQEEERAVPNPLQVLQGQVEEAKKTLFGLLASLPEPLTTKRKLALR